MQETQTAPGAGEYLQPGMPVYGADGTPLGTLDEVVINESTGQTTGILVKHGRVRRGHKQIPTFGIQDVQEDRVILGFDQKEFRLLPDV